MSKIVSILIVIAMTIFFAGCRVQYIPVPVETKVDSVYIEKIVERVDTVKMEIPKEVQVFVAKTDSSHLETSVAISEAVVDSSGLLHHSLTNKDGALEKQIVYKDKIIEKKIEKEVPVIKEVEKIVEVVPAYYKKINIIFWSVIAAVVIFFVIFIWSKVH